MLRIHIKFNKINYTLSINKMSHISQLLFSPSIKNTKVNNKNNNKFT